MVCNALDEVLHYDKVNLCDVDTLGLRKIVMGFSLYPIVMPMDNVQQHD